jgi:hypothetical protein
MALFSLVVFGVIFLLLAIFVKPPRRCYLYVRTIRGESLAWTHTDVAFVRRVVDALEEALADRR